MCECVQRSTPWHFQLYWFPYMFVPVDISSTITSYSNKFWVVFSKTKKSSVHIGCMIGFFVLLRLSVISVALYIYILFISQWVWLGCCGPTLHAKERKEGEKGKFLSYKKKDTLGWLIDLPFLFPISFTPSLNPFPSPVDCWWACSPQTRRQAQSVRVLSVHL